MTAVVVFSLLALLIVFVVFLLKSVRAKMVDKFDDLGLTTRSGKYYLWPDLLRIEYFFALDRANKNKKIHSLHFYFKDGKASVGYLMPNIGLLIEKANQLQVKKSEKTVGYYQK